MFFNWDTSKNRSNIAKHGIDFFDAKEIFNFPMVIKVDNRFDYGEKRWISIGLLGKIIIVMVFTLRGESIRIISARKASQKEKNIYYEKLR